MNALFKLIKSFFGLEGNNLLLVYGDSGTGKTAFGFEVLREVGDVGCGFYVSCGIDRTALLSRYSDLNRYLCEVIDVNDLPFPQEENIYDAVLRSNLPMFLRYLYERAEKVKSALIFIDDFERVSNAIGLDPVSVMELYVSFLRHASLRSIVTVRRNEHLEQIADGVIVLEVKEQDGRVIRKAFVKKLCGLKIRESRFLYTILGGRLLPLSRPLKDIENLPRSILDKIQGLALETGACTGVLGEKLISFGSESFDRLLGGLSNEGLNLPIFDVKVHSLIRALILLNIIKSFINNGGIVLSIGMEPLLHTPPPLCFKMSPLYFPIQVSGELNLDKIASDIKDLLSGRQGKYILLFFNFDYMEVALGNSGVSSLIYSLLNSLALDNICIVGVCSKASRAVQGLASRIFLFQEEAGYTLVCGIKPWTPYYHISVSLTYDGYVKLSLTEIV
ncbi:MAG: gas vesicle protein GvpD P-loop domain-containing protein [Candidatus Jordarchaeales archaeon]